LKDERDNSRAPTPTLAQGALSLALAPAAGGAVAGFACRGRPVLRAPAAGARHADQLACFPLVPFSNRVRDGVFCYRGREIRLPPNHFDPHPLHGDGWQAVWQVSEASATVAGLAYEHAGRAGWPWPYRAEQSFTLEPRGLAARLVLRNLAAEPFPAGLGFHPYFPRAGARLTTDLDGVWLSDATRIPTEWAELPAHWNFSRGLALAGLDIDHCFTGWSGEAILSWPYGSCRITAPPPLDKLVIYVPPGEDFFCIEPVSNVNDGFNLRSRGVPATGVRDLAPGEAFAVEMRLLLEGAW
jgi:aldose 1-epimerase